MVKILEYLPNITYKDGIWAQTGGRESGLESYEADVKATYHAHLFVTRSSSPVIYLHLFSVSLFI